MRTDKEIVARIHEVKDRDILGFEWPLLVTRLSFDLARPFLQKEATEVEWGKVVPRDHETVLSELKDYMPFAWEKANNCRGISAGRSIAHMRAWLWLLGEEDAAAGITDYNMYGKPELRAICEHYEIDWRALDNGRWVNNETEAYSGGGLSPDDVPDVNLEWES